MSNNNNSKSSSETSDVSLWAERIKSIQIERSTPIVRQRILDLKSRIELRNRAVKSASRLEKCNNISTASMISTSLSQSSKNTTLLLADYSELSVQNSARNNSIRLLAKGSVRSAPSKIGGGFGGETIKEGGFSLTSTTPVPLSNDDSDEEDEQLNILEQEVYTSLPESFQARSVGGGDGSVFTFGGGGGFGGRGFGGRGFGGGGQALRGFNEPVNNTAILELLDQLKVEPTEETELTAKFKLFEDFHETVVTIREAVFEFWVQNENLFTVESMRETCKSDLKQIDSNDAMGCLDDESVWFIYHMMVKANSNSIKISKLLSSFKRKLELLQEEPDECPICLEQIEKTNIHILGCSHKTCKTCWNQYKIFKYNRNLLCPLCRHEEFVCGLAQRDY
jgi:hypothetical protein